MRISRIYTEQPLESGALLELAPGPAHYVGTVLRLGADSPLVLFNGDGRELQAVIRETGKKRVLVELGEASRPATESPLRTHLGLGLSRGERMDYAIQKSTELGVSAITPLFTEHCEVKLKRERADRRQAHWRQVAVSACEQSGRVRIPEIHAPLALQDWLAALDSPTRLIFDQRQAQSPAELSAGGEVALLIGPEGGFSAAEVDLAAREGFTGIRLGTRVFRTETAPVAALSVLQFLWGDLK